MAVFQQRKFVMLRDHPLAALIARLAAAKPLSIAHYMELALQHPDYGYYRSRDPFGARGDFITAPETSQMFGELIGLWCVDLWRKLGQPAQFILCELGPGRGTMLRDALRAAAVAPGFLAACRLHLLDNNPVLRAVQAETLGQYAPRWIENLASCSNRSGVTPLPLGEGLGEGLADAKHHISELPNLPAIILANEFFDALPVRQFLHCAEGWRERCIGIEQDALRWVLSPPDPLAHRLLSPEQAALPVGAAAEIAPAAQSLMREAARHIAAHGGAVLAIDYGYEEPSGQPTFQALARHARADPLAAPGEADLTAHVDFAMLAEAARMENLHVWPLLPQGEFLRRLGLHQRAERLAARAAPEQRNALIAALHRLAAPEEMGTLFKVLCCTMHEDLIPAGWE